MDALFALEQPIGMGTGDLDGHTFHSGFVTGNVVEKFELETLGFGPASVHTQEHFGPILGVGAPRTGMNIHDGCGVVMGTRKQGFHLGQTQSVFELVYLALENLEGFLTGVLFSEFEPFLHIGLGLLEFGPLGDFFFELGFFLENGRERIRGVPRTGPGELGLDLLKPFLLASQVKDASRWM